MNDADLQVWLADVLDRTEEHPDLNELLPYLGNGDLFRYLPVSQPDDGCHPHVFAINYVAEMLGARTSNCCGDSNGCLQQRRLPPRLRDREDRGPAFTDHGIECLKQIIADKRAAGIAPPK